MARFISLGILLLVIANELYSGAAQAAKGNSSIAAVVSKFQRIVGGRPTTVANIPYIVALRYDGRFSCGGSLITPRHVLTAAHCVFGFTLSRLIVVAGITRLTDTGVSSAVIRARMTRAFNMDTLNQDVAVLSLARSMVGNNIQPIRLCNRRIRVNAMVRISGWGLTSSSASQVSIRLRTAQIPIISRSVCRRRYLNTDVKIGDSMICAGKLGTRDACNGDSGGPLVYRGQLCGIVSFGVGCATPRFPGVYTSVTALKSFIVQSVR